jgi:hypothetical protein
VLRYTFSEELHYFFTSVLWAEFSTSAHISHTFLKEQGFKGEIYDSDGCGGGGEKGKKAHGAEIDPKIRRGSCWCARQKSTKLVEKNLQCCLKFKVMQESWIRVHFYRKRFYDETFL